MPVPFFLPVRSARSAKCQSPFSTILSDPPDPQNAGPLFPSSISGTILYSCLKFPGVKIKMDFEVAILEFLNYCPIPLAPVFFQGFADRPTR
jgi:hypothetical protein